MSSSLRRGTLAATTLALAVASLSACGAGHDAQTLEIKPDNAATSVGDIKIQNVNVVTSSDSSGPAAVTGRIFNTGSKAETLESVTVHGSTRAELSPAKGTKALTIPAGGSLALGGEGNASALVTSAAQAGVTNGNAARVTFDLSKTGAVKLRATVVPDTQQYEKYGPSVRPSPTTKPGGSPSGSPSGSASPSASEDGKGGGDSARNASDKNGKGSKADAGPSASAPASASASPSTSASHKGGHAGH